MGFGLRPAQSGQQQARQDRDNGNHNQQFDEGKGATRIPEDRWVAHCRAAVRPSKIGSFWSAVTCHRFGAGRLVGQRGRVQIPKVGLQEAVVSEFEGDKSPAKKR